MADYVRFTGLHRNRALNFSKIRLAGHANRTEAIFPLKSTRLIAQNSAFPISKLQACATAAADKTW